MSGLMPVMLDLREKEIVIFGGGEVGERKANLFCQYSKVTVISKEFSAGLNSFYEDGKIRIITVKDINEKDVPSYLKNAFMAIPATNNKDLNEKIAKIARERGIFVNRVDDIGDVMIPSVVRRGDIVISISTAGHSPALSKYIRLKIEEVITPEFEQMSRLQNEIREKIKTVVDGQKKRKEILWNIINDRDVWKAFEESYEKAYIISSKHIR